MVENVKENNTVNNTFNNTNKKRKRGQKCYCDYTCNMEVFYMISGEDILGLILNERSPRT